MSSQDNQSLCSRCGSNCCDRSTCQNLLYKGTGTPIKMSDHKPDPNLPEPVESLDAAISKMYVKVEFQNGSTDWGDAAGTVREFPITLEARNAIKALVEREKQKARIEELLELLSKFVHPIGDNAVGYVSSVEAEKAIRDRLKELREKN